MKVRLAIAQKQSKHHAAGVVSYVRSFRVWQLILYSVVEEQACFYSAFFFGTAEEAMEAGSEKLQVSGADWIKIEEAEVEAYIVQHAPHQWAPSGRKKIRPL